MVCVQHSSSWNVQSSSQLNVLSHLFLWAYNVPRGPKSPKMAQHGWKVWAGGKVLMQAQILLCRSNNSSGGGRKTKQILCWKLWFFLLLQVFLFLCSSGCQWQVSVLIWVGPGTDVIMASGSHNAPAPVPLITISVDISSNASQNWQFLDFLVEALSGCGNALIMRLSAHNGLLS